MAISAKDIIVKPIKSNVANDFVKKHHYSGKVVANSQLHFGCFLNGILGGVMSFGPSIRKDLIQGLVFDPFSGSGTTAIACREMGLDFICIEKDPDYYVLSVKRLEDYSKQGNLFEQSKQTFNQMEFKQYGESTES